MMGLNWLSRLHSVMCSLPTCTLQIKFLLNEYTINVNREGALLGDTLESALEYGEKYEDLVTNLKTVSHFSCIRSNKTIRL